MSSLLSRLTSPKALLYIFVVLTQLATGSYLASGLEPPGFFTFAYGLAFLWIVGWWLRTDSRERGIGWVFDMGLFLYIAWPLVIPYYLFKSRGARGLLVILGFVGAYGGAGLAGMVLYLFFAPADWPRAL
jgi:hypothetical protein